MLVICPLVGATKLVPVTVTSRESNRHTNSSDVTVTETTTKVKYLFRHYSKKILRLSSIKVSFRVTIYYTCSCIDLGILLMFHIVLKKKRNYQKTKYTILKKYIFIPDSGSERVFDSFFRVKFSKLKRK